MEADKHQLDFFSDLSDLDFVRLLLAELHDDLPGKVSRFWMLIDSGRELGPNGTMIPGGHVAYHAWVEARSSFVHGNFLATVLLCQGLVEHLLAAHLHGALLVDNLPERVVFHDTLRYCREHNVISEQDGRDLRKLMDLRNPLSHFRHLHDESNLDRRSIDSGETADDLMRRDAVFAIGLAVRILAKPEFRLG